MAITPKQFLSPFLRGTRPEYRGWHILKLKPATRKDNLVSKEASLVLYKSPPTPLDKDIEHTQVLLEVEIEHAKQSFFYHYPIDLNYLFSPQWKQDNVSSPFGFFRWAAKMDTALRLNAIPDLSGHRLMESITAKISGKAKKFEGKGCKFKNLQASRSKSLELHTFLLHLTENGIIDSFKGNHNQIALAEKIGISHLGHLFTALSALRDPKTNKSWAEVLGYNQINLPVKTVKDLEIELKKNHSTYIGNHNQIPLAEKIGISHLGHLFTALSALRDPKTNKSWAEVLGYNVIDLPVKTVKNLEIKLKKNYSPFIGNHNQIPLAEEVGISNLGQIFSALSALRDPKTNKSWAEVLGYNVIALPVKTVKEFFKDLVDFVEQTNFPYYKISKALQDKTPEEAKKIFLRMRDAHTRMPA